MDNQNGSHAPQNTIRIRKIKQKFIKTLKLLDRISDFPSDDENEIVSSRKTSHLQSIKNRTANKSKMLERIPPPVRLYDHSNPIDSFGDSDFADRYGFDKKTTLYILGLIEYGLLRPSNRGHPVTPLIQLLVTLRFLCTGEYYRSKLYKTINHVYIIYLSRWISIVRIVWSERTNYFAYYQSSDHCFVRNQTAFHQTTLRFQATSSVQRIPRHCWSFQYHWMSWCNTNHYQMPCKMRSREIFKRR